jgi:hypothetical protein
VINRKAVNSSIFMSARFTLEGLFRSGALQISLMVGATP